MTESSTSKYSFRNDYSEIAHPEILAALSAVGKTQFDGYGLDEFSIRAADLLRSAINRPSAEVHFIGGGTHANLVVLSSILRPHEAVIAPGSGHIYVHETGAIEATGHKICIAPGSSGKLHVSEIEAILNEHEDEHMVKPRIVYISQTTECGTVYSREELSAISEFCGENGLYLYLDGARLGAAINSHACDLTYSDIAELTDVFYVGGTKNGALFGEAIVICTDELKPDFRFHLKQKGAMLAKGAAIGVQFEALWKNGLYDRLAQTANAAAMKLAKGIMELGYGFLYPPVTNLIIPTFPDEIAGKLHGLYGFYEWQKREGMTSVRIVTSWATPESIIDEFIADLASMS